MRKSALQPRSRKTPRGGRMMARMILQMSLSSHRTSAVSLILSSTCSSRLRERDIAAEQYGKSRTTAAHKSGTSLTYLAVNAILKN